MERVRRDDGTMPNACFMCPARVLMGGQDFCDPRRLDDKNLILKVARYRPNECPSNVKVVKDTREIPPEILLRKILRK